MDDDCVELICINEKGKLRVKIITNGYYNDANCQFPKKIRLEGRKYKVNKVHVKLITQRGKYFYSIKTKDIQILDEDIDLSNLKIYENPDIECIICMVNAKNRIFNCGHYYCCDVCASRITKCPICREVITNIIDSNLMQ